MPIVYMSVSTVACAVSLAQCKPAMLVVPGATCSELAVNTAVALFQSDTMWLVRCTP